MLDMRFPGQRYDTASALNQNYFRDYEPAIGRYVQSDPIGLSGGVGTYAYVGSNPIDFIDRLGLTKEDIDCMYALAKELEKDLKFPRKDPLTRDFGPPDENGMVTRGMWNPLTRQLYVSDIYLQHLSHAQLEDLYGTLVHEVLHPNRGLKGASKAGHTALAEEANRRTKLANPTDRCGCGR